MLLRLMIVLFGFATTCLRVSAQPSDVKEYEFLFSVRNHVTKNLETRDGVAALVAYGANPTYYLVTAHHVVDGTTATGLEFAFSQGPDRTKIQRLRAVELCDWFYFVPEWDLAVFHVRNTQLLDQFVPAAAAAVGAAAAAHGFNIHWTPIGLYQAPVLADENPDHRYGRYLRFVKQAQALRSYGVIDPLEQYRLLRGGETRLLRQVNSSIGGPFDRYGTYAVADAEVIGLPQLIDVLAAKVDSPAVQRFRRLFEADPMRQMPVLLLETSRVRRGFSGSPLVFTPSKRVVAGPSGQNTPMMVGMILAISGKGEQFDGRRFITIAVTSELIAGVMSASELRRSGATLPAVNPPWEAIFGAITDLDVAAQGEVVLGQVLGGTTVLPVGGINFNGEDASIFDRDPKYALDKTFKSNFNEAQASRKFASYVRPFTEWDIAKRIAPSLTSYVDNNLARAQPWISGHFFEDQLARRPDLFANGLVQFVNVARGTSPLEGANFRGTVFLRCHFEGIELRGGDLSGAVFDSCTFSPDCRFRPTFFSGITFRGVEKASDIPPELLPPGPEWSAIRKLFPSDR